MRPTLVVLALLALPLAASGPALATCVAQPPLAGCAFVAPRAGPGGAVASTWGSACVSGADCVALATDAGCLASADAAVTCDLSVGACLNSAGCLDLCAVLACSTDPPFRCRPDAYPTKVIAWGSRNPDCIHY